MNQSEINELIKIFLASNEYKNFNFELQKPKYSNNFHLSAYTLLQLFNYFAKEKDNKIELFNDENDQKIQNFVKLIAKKFIQHFKNLNIAAKNAINDKKNKFNYHCPTFDVKYKHNVSNITNTDDAIFNHLIGTLIDKDKIENSFRIWITNIYNNIEESNYLLKVLINIAFITILQNNKFFKILMAIDINNEINEIEFNNLNFASWNNINSSKKKLNDNFIVKIPNNYHSLYTSLLLTLLIHKLDNEEHLTDIINFMTDAKIKIGENDINEMRQTLISYTKNPDINHNIFKDKLFSKLVVDFPNFICKKIKNYQTEQNSIMNKHLNKLQCLNHIDISGEYNNLVIKIISELFKVDIYLNDILFHAHLADAIENKTRIYVIKIKNQYLISKKNTIINLLANDFICFLTKEIDQLLAKVAPEIHLDTTNFDDFEDICQLIAKLKIIKSKLYYQKNNENKNDLISIFTKIKHLSNKLEENNADITKTKTAVDLAIKNFSTVTDKLKADNSIQFSDIFNTTNNDTGFDFNDKFLAEFNQDPQQLKAKFEKLITKNCKQKNITGQKLITEIEKLQNTTFIKNENDKQWLNFLNKAIDIFLIKSKKAATINNNAQLDLQKNSSSHNSVNLNNHFYCCFKNCHNKSDQNDKITSNKQLPLQHEQIILLKKLKYIIVFLLLRD